MRTVTVKETIVGSLSASGELRCAHCTHLLGLSKGATGVLSVKCNSCKHINGFCLPESGPTPLIPGRLNYLHAVETTDQCLAEALRDLVATFHDFLDDRRTRRLVAV